MDISRANRQSLVCAAVVFALGALVGGCATQAPPPAAPVAQTLQVPVIVPQPETEARQVKGGLEVTIAPVNYHAEVHQQVALEPAQPPTGLLLVNSHVGDVYVRRSTANTAVVAPDHLSFLVTINNKMPRVFRGTGTVVQFNIDGKVLAVDQRGYSNLLNAIIPPQNQQQLTIVGPALSELQPKGILGIFLYDVVTEQNDAGVVTEKQNYTWYFSYSLEPQIVQVPANTVQGLYMPMAEAQRAMQEQNMRGAQQQMQQWLPPGAMVPAQMTAPGQ